MTATLEVDVAPAERTLPRLLARQAARYAGRALFSCRGEVWSFKDAVDIAARAAGSLSAAGIRPGERVAIVCSNRPEFMRIVLG